MTNRISELEQLIVHHKEKYYRGEAEISDAAFDALEDELRSLKPDSDVLSVVGTVLVGQKVPHERPMLSLDKRRDAAEVISWMDGAPCMVTDKMDGSSASLIYRGGRLWLVKTRGDGVFGENITRYFEHIRCPKQLQGSPWQQGEVEIRGEVCISRSAFDLLSGEMVARGLERPNSIRNIVAGLLHRKDDIDLCRHLTFFAYEALSDENAPLTEEDKFTALAGQGFTLPRRQLLMEPQLFVQVVADYQRTLDSYEYLTDGLVLAVNDVAAQLSRGFTAHHPKGKLAFKLKSDVAQTTVEEIIVDVGRTGKLTFVGVVSPVVLSSATVRRVTLNNVKYIEENRINVGCRIEITRSGEVIPKHERTLETCGEFGFPTACPLCNQSLVRSETGVDLLCTNAFCRARMYGRVANWIDVIGIENLGGSTLDKLWERETIRGIADLYRLNPGDISPLEGMGDRSARKIIDNITGTKRLTVEKFLAGLGIDGLGKGVAKLVATRYPTAEALLEVTPETLRTINGIGEVLAVSIHQGLSAIGFPLRDELMALGVELVASEAPTGGAFSGKTLVITGTLSRPRKEIEMFIEANGGKTTSAVSAGTAYLVCNEASSSSKFKKAQSLGVPVISEQQLFDMAPSIEK